MLSYVCVEGRVVRHFVLLVVALLVACGQAEPKGEPKTGVPKLQPTAYVSFGAEQHTPGYFRDMYRLVSAVSLLDDETAATRLRLELENRVVAPDTLDVLTPEGRATVDGLLVLALRAVQATADTAAISRRAGELLLSRTLLLDPARAAWNDAHPEQPAEAVAPGAQTLARAALEVLDVVGGIAPLSCSMAAAGAASWDPGTPEYHWVEGGCDDDTWVPGYCEADRWVEGECTQVWVPESCSGGSWRDDGYYEYRCYSDDDCRYEWVSRWTYVDGSCDGGYYEEDCYSGYSEPGLCYDGHWEEGACQDGYWQAVYSSGWWSYDYVTAPQECTVVRPAQLAIAESAIFVLAAKASEELDASWQSALDKLSESFAEGSGPEGEAGFDACMQVLQAAAQ